MRRTDQKADSVLDPIERVTEVIFGALMALTFTGSFSVASPGEEVRTMMWAAARYAMDSPWRPSV